MTPFISTSENFKSILGWVTFFHIIFILLLFFIPKFHQPKKIVLLQLLPQGALVKGETGLNPPIPQPAKAPSHPLKEPVLPQKIVTKPITKPTPSIPAQKPTPSINLKEVKRTSTSKPVTPKPLPTPAQKPVSQAPTLNASDIKNRLQGRVGKAGVASASADGQSGAWNGVQETSEANAYFVLIRDIYYQAWNQPTLGVDKKLAAILKIRVGKQGNILNTTLEQSSGNVILDNSIQAAARTVKTLGTPLPEVLGTQFADISIVFEF
jgi:TonB family protein